MMSLKGLGKAGYKVAGAKPLDYLREAERERVAYYEGKGGESVAPASWLGKGAATLGLVGKANLDDMDPLAMGRRPGKRFENLVKGAGKEHRVGYDVTFSAPKAVSLAYGFADDELKQLIIEAHHKAVEAAIGYLEELAITRTGTDGCQIEKVKGLVATRFTHFASRELDPQLHDHVLVFNVAEKEDGTFGTVESLPFFQSKMTAGALYRLKLSLELAKLGFSIERDSERKEFFTIEGMEGRQLKAFSKRREQILAELERTGGRGSKASQFATLATRRAKDEPPYPDLMRMWQEAGAELGLDAERIAALRVFKEGVFSLDEKALLNEITEQSSTFMDRDILKLVACAAVGFWDIPEARATAKRILEGPEIVDLGVDKRGNRRYTTRSMYELEKEIVESFQARAKSMRTDGQGPTREMVARLVSSKIRQLEGKERKEIRFEEQEAAAHFICCETGKLAIIEGWAGTGKTTLLDIVGDAYKEAGFNCIGAALAGKAAYGLQVDSKIISNTLHKLLMELDGIDGKPPTRVLTDRDVLILDESGMVGSRMMHRLVRHADRAGAKIVLVGDPKQLQAIEAGGILRTAIAKVGRQSLERIQRQKVAIDYIAKMESMFREHGTRAIQLTGKDQAKGFDSMLAAAEFVASTYADSPKPSEMKVAIASEQRIGLLNDMIAKKLEEAGALGAEEFLFEGLDGQQVSCRQGLRIAWEEPGGKLRAGVISGMDGSGGIRVGMSRDGEISEGIVPPEAFGTVRVAFAVDRATAVSTSDERDEIMSLAERRRPDGATQYAGLFTEGFGWLRDAVRNFATAGGAASALASIEERGCLTFGDNIDEALERLIANWKEDAESLKDKLIFAATRADVTKANRAAREHLKETGQIGGRDFEFDVGSPDSGVRRSVSVGERIIFTRPSRQLEILNGTLGRIDEIRQGLSGSLLLTVTIDGSGGEPPRTVKLDTGVFSDIDHGYCITVHKSQGATVNTAHVLLSESMVDREWIYVAASRTRYSMRFYSPEQDISHLMDEDRQARRKDGPLTERQAQIQALAERMDRSHMKDTSQDYGDPAIPAAAPAAQPGPAEPKAAKRSGSRKSGQDAPRKHGPAKGHFKGDSEQGSSRGKGRSR